MSITELSNLVGQACEWKASEDCYVPAVIRDARSSYGRTDVYVEPVGGRGGLWVRRASVEIEKGEK